MWSASGELSSRKRDAWVVENVKARRFGELHGQAGASRIPSLRLSKSVSVHAVTSRSLGRHQDRPIVSAESGNRCHFACDTRSSANTFPLPAHGVQHAEFPHRARFRIGMSFACRNPGCSSAYARLAKKTRQVGLAPTGSSPSAGTPGAPRNSTYRVHSNPKMSHPCWKRLTVWSWPVLVYPEPWQRSRTSVHWHKIHGDITE